MTHEEARALLISIMQRRNFALAAIVAPARSAFNAMKEAKLDRSADPLGEALFKLEALDSELSKFIEENGHAAVGALGLILEGMKR